MPAERLRVAEVDELPPGRGKTILVGGREVTIVNREGRYVVSAARPTSVADTVRQTVCELPGHHFSVAGAQDADGHDPEPRAGVAVEVQGGGIYVIVDEVPA